MGNGKRKIEIEPITDYQSRMVAFTRRKNGLFKKAQMLEEKSGTSISIVVISETGQPYLHGSPSLLEQYLASTTTAPSSSAATGSCTTTAEASSSATTAPTGCLEERYKELEAWVNSQVEACTTKEEAESLKRKLLEMKESVDSRLGTR